MWEKEACITLRIFLATLQGCAIKKIFLWPPFPGIQGWQLGFLVVSRSAFFWFSQDERKKVREANPKFGVGEVAKELGRRWADIDPVLKKKYEGLAEEDRKRYSQAKTDYKNSLKGGSAKKGLSSPTGSAVPPLSEPSLSNYNRSGSLVLDGLNTQRNTWIHWTFFVFESPNGICSLNQANRTQHFEICKGKYVFRILNYPRCSMTPRLTLSSF